MALLGALALRVAARAASLTPKIHDAVLKAGQLVTRATCMPSALCDGTAPSASLDHLKAQVTAKLRGFAPCKHQAGGRAAEALQQLTQWEGALLTRLVQMHADAQGSGAAEAAFAAGAGAAAAENPLLAQLEPEEDEAFEAALEAALNPAAPESTAPKAALPASYFRAARRAPAAPR